MTANKEVTIWCDYPDCVEWTVGGGANHTTLEARKGARKEGWTTRYVSINGESTSGRKDFGLKDFCPKHELPRGTTDVTS